MEKKGCSYKCDIAIYTRTLYMYIYYTCERVFGVGGFCDGMAVVGRGRFPGLLCIRKLLILPGRRLDRINQASQKVLAFYFKTHHHPDRTPRHRSQAL